MPLRKEGHHAIERGKDLQSYSTVYYSTMY